MPKADTHPTLEQKKISWEADDPVNTIRGGLDLLTTTAAYHREVVGPQIEFVAEKLNDSIERMQELLESVCGHAGVSLVRLSGDNVPEAAA